MLYTHGGVFAGLPDGQDSTKKSICCWYSLASCLLLLPRFTGIYSFAPFRCKYKDIIIMQETGSFALFQRNNAHLHRDRKTQRR